MSDNMESIQMNKAPMLKPSEFDMWKIRIRQHMLLTDFNMWEIVEYGPRIPLETEGEESSGGVKKKRGPPTSESERKERQIELKALSTLLLAIPNEYQRKFSTCVDAKELWDALEKRFGGTKATKRNQKDVLKQQYENFKASRNETMAQTFDRFVKLTGEMENVGVEFERDDLNRKFLRSLNEEWSIYTISLRQADTLENKELDDLYNDLKVFEGEVEAKRQSPGYSHNAAFVSSSSTAPSTEASGISQGNWGLASSSQTPTTEECNAVLESFFVSHINSPLTNDDLGQVNVNDLEEMDIKWQMAMLTVRARKYLQRTGKRDFNFRKEDKAGFDKSKVECYNCHKLGHFARECQSEKREGARVSTNNGSNNRSVHNQGSSSTALVTQNDGMFDWSFQAEDIPQNQALMAETSSLPDLPEEVKSKLCSQICIQTVNKYREQNTKVNNSFNRMNEERISALNAIITLEKQIKAYQKNEEQFDYDLKYARWERDCARDDIEDLKKELAQVRAEKEQMKIDIGKLENASKSVNSVIQAQIHDKIKAGVGYNQVPPPFNHNYIPPTTDAVDRIKSKMNIEETPKIDLGGSTNEKGECSSKVNVVVEGVVCDDSDSDTEVVYSECDPNLEEKKRLEKKKVRERIEKEKSKSVNAKSKMDKGKGKVEKREERKQESTPVTPKPKAKPEPNSKPSDHCPNCILKSKSNGQTRGNQRNWNQKMSQVYGGTFKKAKHCFICGRTNHLAKRCFYNPLNQEHSYYHNYGYENRNVHGFSHKRKGFKKGKASQKDNTVKIPVKTQAAQTPKVNTANSTNSQKKVKKVYAVKRVNTVSGVNTAGNVNTANKVNTGSKVNTDASTKVNTASTNVNTANANVNTASEKVNAAYVLKDISYYDANGTPKTTMAWVPKSN
mgnify:CR=1 FL=1